MTIILLVSQDGARSQTMPREFVCKDVHMCNKWGTSFRQKWEVKILAKGALEPTSGNGNFATVGNFMDQSTFAGNEFAAG